MLLENVICGFEKLEKNHPRAASFLSFVCLVIGFIVCIASITASDMTATICLLSLDLLFVSLLVSLVSLLYLRYGSEC